MDDLNLLVKPASGLCNMACRYCFYRDELEHFKELNMDIMSEETMRLLAARACGEAERRIHVTFQGGEPTLAGLDFFRSFVACMEGQKKRGTRISYSIQTNGLLLDEAWAVFFAEHHVLVGLSFDGTPRIHDANRTDRGGRGTAARAEAAWKLLREHGVEVNLLCVVTGQAAGKPEQVYRYLKGLGAEYLQFIPCIAPSDGPAGQPWLLTPDRYAYFLKAVFDQWYLDLQQGRYVSVRHLDDYLRLLHGRYPSSCAALGRCGGYFVVENDGSVYPCDYFVGEKWKLGDIRQSAFAELAESGRMREFLDGSGVPGACRACPYYALCRGGCRNDHREEGGERRNVLCGAYREFFAYALDRLRKIKL